MDADVREASLLVRYVAEPHLRTLAHRLRINDFFELKQATYVNWIGDEKRTLRKLYGHEPTPAQLRKACAASILDEEEFFDYLCDVGHSDDLEDEMTLERVAHIAAAIIVGLYADSLAPPPHRKAARGA